MSKFECLRIHPSDDVSSLDSHEGAILVIGGTHDFAGLRKARHVIASGGARITLPVLEEVVLLQADRGSIVEAPALRTAESLVSMEGGSISASDLREVGSLSVSDAARHADEDATPALVLPQLVASRLYIHDSKRPVHLPQHSAPPFRLVRTTGRFGAVYGDGTSFVDENGEPVEEHAS